MQQTIAGQDALRMGVLSRSLRVLIADDHPWIRRSLREDLEAAGIEVCAEAETSDGAVRAALAQRPDLCLLDVRMTDGDGITAARSIRRSLPDVRIVLITALPDERGALAAARAGADGYLAKDVDRRRLGHIVRVVAEGETTYPRRMLGLIVRAVQSPDRLEN